MNDGDQAEPRIAPADDVKDEERRPRRHWRRTAEATLGLVLAGVALAGMVVDLAGSPVRPDLPSAEAAFHARARFCPPALRGGSSRMTIAASGAPGAPPAAIGLEPVQRGKSQPPEGELLVHGPATPVPVDVVGYGGTAYAAAMARFETPVSGIGGAPCAVGASTHWFFAEGSSILGFDQRIVVYNPFPDEAVIRVTFFTPTGAKAKANLADVAVPAGTSVGLRVNDFILRQGTLAAEVEAIRGRVVAWRALLAKPEDRPHGGQLSLGAPAPAPVWYFPDGGTGAGIDERLTVLNPGDEEAIVTISLVAGNDIHQPPRLVEVKVKPRHARSFSLPAAVRGSQARLGGAGAIVRSINDVPVVAERTVWYRTGAADGVSSEVGVADPAPSWWVPPAATAPTTDSLVLLNPGSERVTAHIVLLRGDGPPLTPRALASVAVPAQGRLRVPLSSFTGGTAMVAFVTADGALVAERFAYSDAAGDVASVMGVPAAD